MVVVDPEQGTGGFLMTVGALEPQPELVVQPPLPKGQGDLRLRDRADVEEEIAEREAVSQRVLAWRQELLAQQDEDD